MNYTKVGNEIETNRDDNDIRRVKFALAKAAKNVLKENPATENHSARAVFAVDIVKGNYNLTPLMYVLFTDAAIENKGQFGGVSDVELQTAVDSLFSVLAGIG